MSSNLFRDITHLSRRAWRALLLAALAAALAGCSPTLFESVPAGTASACDPRLVGTWRTGEWTLDEAEDRVDEEDATYLVVTPGCEVLDWYSRKVPSDLAGYDRPTFIAAAGRHYAAVRYRQDDEDKGGGIGVDDDKDAGRPEDAGFLLFRYVVSGDRIAVHQIDSRRVARLIARKQISGRTRILDDGDGDDVSGDDEPQLVNVVSGSDKEIAALLRARPDLFLSGAMGILHRYRGTPPPRDEAQQTDNDAERPR